METVEKMEERVSERARGKCEKGEKNPDWTDLRRQNHHGMASDWKRRQEERKGKERRGIERRLREGRESGRGGKGREKEKGKGREKGREGKGRKRPTFYDLGN